MAENYVGKRALNSQTTPKRKLCRGCIAILILALALAAGLVGVLISGGSTPEVKPPALIVKQVPPVKGGLTIPFSDDFGDKPCKPVYDGSATVTDGVASDGVTADKNAFDPRNCERAASLKVPINGECPWLKDGSLGAPSDYTTVCAHRDKRGGTAYLGHSILGPRVGALEYIHNLKPGDIVKVGDQKYEVQLVSIFPKSGLPERLWQKGHFSLITCYVSAQALKDGRTTENVVVELGDAK